MRIYPYHNDAGVWRVWEEGVEEEEEDIGDDLIRHGEEPPYLRTVRYRIQVGGDLLILRSQGSDMDSLRYFLAIIISPNHT